MEDTMIDAPVTPAPVFAYRALRGMIFGSPDDSPTRRTTRKNETLLDNVRITETSIRLTPSNKRKRDSNNLLSPTKSCLRTPGITTPRRVMLKDVTVTFKDLKNSVSPEVPKKIAKTQTHHDDNNKENQNINLSKSSTNSKTVNPPIKVICDTTPACLLPAECADSSLAPNFDIHSYMSTTEKEMKRLIKYSQKMREYARKQDQENVKLRGLIEELKHENARLRRNDDTNEDQVDARMERSNRRQTSSRSDQYTTKETGPAESKRPSQTERLRSRSTREQLAINDLLNLDRDQHVSKATKTSRMLSTNNSDLHVNNHPERQQTHDPSPPSQLIFNHPKNSHNNVISPVVSAQEQPVDNQTISKAPQPQSIIRDLNTNTGTITRLPSDRLAAARARVRQKAEKRKTSNELEADTDIGNKVEDSAVEWAGL